MTRSKPTLETIATAYGMTRQNLHHVMRVNGFSREDMLAPGEIFQRLLWGKSSRLRTRLRNPFARGHIVRKLQP
jgi:hypothetical protein